MKTIFLDCDGTLTDYSEHMSDSTKEACRLANERGHRLVLCTGRSKCTITKDCLDLPISGIIAGNGGFIEYKGEIIENNPIEDKIAHEIVDLLISKKRPFFLETDYTTAATAELMKFFINDFDNYAEEVPEITKTFIKRCELLNDLHIRDINKVTFVMAKGESIAEYQMKYPFLRCELIFPSEEKQRFAEYTVKGIDKGFGIREYQKLTNTKKEDCIAIGDWDNDLIMFYDCQEGVAMGNGSKGIKEKATYITTSVFEDGIYNAFKHFDLI